MNPTDSSTKPPDSTTNKSESSTNPSDSSIIPTEDDAAAVTLIPINRKTQMPPFINTIVENQQLMNDIDENHLIEVLVDDLVTEGDLPEDKDEDATVKEVHGKIPVIIYFFL